MTGSGAERNIYGSATLNKHLKKVPHQVIIRVTPLIGSMPIGRTVYSILRYYGTGTLKGTGTVHPKCLGTDTYTNSF